MLKKILSLTLCLCICFGVVFSVTSCGSDEDSSSSNTTTSTAKVPTTLSFLGITSEETDQENVEMVEEALNEIFAARFKTKIDLTLVTEEEYMDLVEQRIEIAKEYKVYDNAIAQYNAYIKKQANKTSTTDKIIGNWISGDVKVSLETLATRLVYVSEQTTVHEDGRVETLYPEAPSPVDIVMIVDEKMYDEFTDMGLLLDKNIDPTLKSYKNLQKYIYPTFFTELKALKGTVNAIPNNNMLAESTYLVVNKALAEKYDFNIEAFKNYGDLRGFLAKMKEGKEEIVLFKDEPEALGVFKLFSEDVAIGAYLDPLVGYNPEEGEKYANYEVKNLFEIKEYTDHLKLMEEYRKEGYFSKNDYVLNGYAIEVVKGDASIMAKYDREDSEYLVKEIQVPFVLREAIFDGMLAPTAYTSDITRAMEIIEAINTDPDVKNLLQYGIEEYNYIPHEESGSIIQLNGSYIMDNSLTGNVYMGYIPYQPDGESGSAWSYVMQTNLASISSPFLLFPVDEAYLQANLKDILVRAGLAEALDVSMGISYSDYANASAADLADYRKELREKYRDLIIKELVEQGRASDETKAAELVKSYDIVWVEETIAQQYIENRYGKIATLEEIDALVGQKISGNLVGYVAYNTAREKAKGYLDNIKSLRVIAKETIFADMSEADYEAKYGVLGALEFEKAVYEYLKANYEKENNLTEEDYKTLVEDFIATNFKFTDRATKQEYTYTWAEFLTIKEKALEFGTPLQTAKAQYNEWLRDIGGASQAKIDGWNYVELADKILDVIRKQFYRSQGFSSQSEFETWIYDNAILSKYSITKQELDILKVKDNTLYKDYLAKIKKDFKSQLLTTYTKDEYAAMKDTAAITAVLDYYVEYYTKAYETLCGVMGLTREELTEGYKSADEYISCVDTKLKQSFLYTLRTKYDDATINSWTIAEAEKAVYDIVYESGYYMNELAKCIGIDLSDYNNKKSEAIKYLGDPEDLAYNPGYLADVIRAYEGDLAKRGITVEQARAMEPEKIEAIIHEIIREKDFSDYVTIDVELAKLCKYYVDGVKSYTYDDNYKDDNGKDFVAIDRYCQYASDKLEDNYLFTAIVSYLNDSLQAKLDAANG